MNILFAAHIRTTQETNYLNTIVDVLIRGGNKPTLALRKNKHSRLTENAPSASEHLTYSEPDKLQQKHYDLMLTYNTTGSRQLKTLAKRKDIPTVCMMDAFTIVREYPIGQKHLNKIVLIAPPQ